MTDALRDRIQTGLHLGLLHGGDRIDSIRDVAATLHVRPKTALDAYRALAGEGLVEVRARSGVYVGRGTAPAAGLPSAAADLVDFFLRALSHGVPPADVLREMHGCLQLVAPRAACIECNEDQSHALQSQLVRDYGFSAFTVEVDRLGGRTLPPALRTADLIVTTRFHADEARRAGRRLGRPVVEAVLDAAFYSEVRRLLAAGPLFWLCTDERFAAKLARMWPGCSITPVVLGRDAIDAVPPGAPVYATQRALERLGPSWRARVVSVRRAFSIETARELVTFRLGKSLSPGPRAPRAPAR